MRIALIHDWLTGMRGGERALLAFCEMFPDADLFTLVRVPGATDPIIERRRVRTSLIQSLPFPGRLYRHYLPLFPIAIEQFDLDGYDLVLSTSHCAAKSVVVPGHTRHLCYCLTPMRYAWDQFDAYFGPERVGPAMNRLMRPVMAAMARWDRATEARVHRYLAISQYVARRISLYYNRGASIVYPPVETTFYTPAPSEMAVGPAVSAAGMLVVSALVPYKRVDLAIKAAERAKLPLTIVGDGPERVALEALGGDGVRFLGWCTNEEIRDLYRSSIATILPGEEDFGIVPLEAQACGRPVVALGRGGALETVIDGETGVLVEPGEDALADGLQRAARMTWDSSRIRRHAEAFSRDRFVRDIQAAIAETMAEPPGQRW
ncbi:MAG TPA: glycosyltransferase [Vicinamibacterales bacterium]|nr:glycosyltransferase [Vicinamibacterales bacterium]